MKNYCIPVCLLLFSLTSCLKNPASLEDDSGYINWHDFVIKQVNYDSLYIESGNTILLNGLLVQQIVLLEADNNMFIPQDTIIPTYVASGDNYYLNFQFRKKVSKEILHYHFKLQYKIKEGVVEIDSTHLMLLYPYQSAQVFITADEVHPDYKIYFQDIDFNEDYLFFHPGGSLGLYKYNIQTKQTTVLAGYFGGDFIAHDSIYVFIDDSHRFIRRYNLESDTIDLEFNLASLIYNRINGIECFNGFVYVIFENSLAHNYIAKFDFEGNYLDSVPYANSRYCLTIESGIAYSQDYGSALFRFDLSTNTDLKEKLTPVYNGAGIRIVNDKLFFVDWDKRCIGFIPISDINEN